MIERKWLAVTATPLTSDGSTIGVVTVADTAGFYTKQQVFLASSTKTATSYQVQEVVSKTKLVLGPIGPKVGRNNFSDLSGYLVSDGCALAAPEQDKGANPPDKDHYSAIYASDPIVADRVIFVDQYGKYYGEGNPLPIAFDGTIALGDVEIKFGSNILKVNPDGSINVNVVQSPVTGQIEKNIFNEVASVASGVETLIVSYTVPVGKTAVLHRISTSGDNVGRYNLYLNGQLYDAQRTYYGGEFNATFDFTTGTANGVSLNVGDFLQVKILHTRQYVGNFNARIQVLEIA